MKKLLNISKVDKEIIEGISYFYNASAEITFYEREDSIKFVKCLTEVRKVMTEIKEFNLMVPDELEVRFKGVHVRISDEKFEEFLEKRYLKPISVTTVTESNGFRSNIKVALYSRDVIKHDTYKSYITVGNSTVIVDYKNHTKTCRYCNEAGHFQGECDKFGKDNKRNKEQHRGKQNAQTQSSSKAKVSDKSAQFKTVRKVAILKGNKLSSTPYHVPQMLRNSICLNINTAHQADQLSSSMNTLDMEYEEDKVFDDNGQRTPTYWDNNGRAGSTQSLPSLVRNTSKATLDCLQKGIHASTGDITKELFEIASSTNWYGNTFTKCNTQNEEKDSITLSLSQDKGVAKDTYSWVATGVPVTEDEEEEDGGGKKSHTPIIPQRRRRLMKSI